jgi:hypothetical protein
MNILRAALLTLLSVIPGSLYAQDFSKISSVIEVSIPNIISLLPEKKKSEWNIVGVTWTKKSLINHLLTHTNHKNKFKKETLQSLTLKQLWFVHDEDHEGRKVTFTFTQATPKTTVICPGGS